MLMGPSCWAALSAWPERRWLAGRAGSESRVWLDEHGRTAAGEEEADVATEGLCALHVLARDCTDPSLVRAAVAKAGAAALLTPDRHGELPLHKCAAAGSSEYQTVLGAYLCCVHHAATACLFSACRCVSTIARPLFSLAVSCRR